MRKKRIGIINHWMVNNYGALFLAYALERRIRELGYDVETVSWLPDEVRFPWKTSMIKKTGFIQYLLRLGYFSVFVLPRQTSFRRFRSMMHTSKVVYTDATLPAIRDKYDKIVIGGDQLWNCKINYYNENNFLPFVEDKSKKVVYAASLSQDHMREELKDTFKRLAEGFSYVTTREKRATEIIEELTDLKAPRVADPAFLLNAEEWAELAEGPKESGEYVFVYQVQSDKLVIDFAKALAKQNGCSIVFCPFPLKKQIRCRRKPYMSPERWLGYMKNAKYVVTDAFHGTVFSIIFNRQFFAEISEYGKDTGSRITNILDVYSLQDRLLTQENRQQMLNCRDIDFENVNILIEREKRNAEKHLLTMLGDTEMTVANDQKIVPGGGILVLWIFPASNRSADLQTSLSAASCEVAA